MTSTYIGTVAPEQQLYINNQNGQTQLSIASGSAGQQQRQNSSFATGEWRSPPALYCTASGVVLQICGQQGDTWIQLQGQQMQVIAAPAVVEADRVELQTTSTPPTMQPLPPLKMGNMKMGNMEMQMQPMWMKMGDMEMQMGAASSTETSPSQLSSSHNFCSHCGQPLQSSAASGSQSNRFCANCGHPLTH